MAKFVHGDDRPAILPAQRVSRGLGLVQVERVFQLGAVRLGIDVLEEGQCVRGQHFRDQVFAFQGVQYPFPQVVFPSIGVAELHQRVWST